MYFPPLIGNNWATTSPSSLGWCQPEIDTLLDFLEAENTKAFILLKNGRIVIEQYFGTFTADSSWYWASAGKTLTAMTVGIAQEEGHLSINDETSDYLGTGWTSATLAKENLIKVKDQLRMSSGLNDLVADPKCTLPSCLQYLADAGTRWAYHNGPYTLLDTVILSATGVNLNTYVYQKIGSKIGMSGLFVKLGYDNVFFSKPRSMARFGLLLLNRGKWNNTTVLGDTAYFGAMTRPSQTMNPAYGYLTWLNGQASYKLPGLQFSFSGPICPDAPSDMYAALGKNGQLINVVPSQGLVFIRMGHDSNTADVSHVLSNEIWKRLNEVMCNGPSARLSNPLESLSIYPNPATTTVRLSGTENLSNFSTSLLDLQGRTLWQGENRTEVSLNNLRAGIYFVEVKADGQVWREKIVKQ